jgi:hypothetical protein
MILRLALRNVGFKPWRSVVLFLGFGFGVAVMIVLLSIGEAMVRQASDERLIGGGDVTVLPSGIDIEVLQTGGLGGLFFSIANARFLYLQLLAAPRLAPDVRAVAPEIEGRPVYLTAPGGATYPVRATGEIPSATQAVGAAPALDAGAWTDDAGDRRWRAPTQAELDADIDHFHLPSRALADRRTWAEWHYFNVLSADRHHWAFISFIVAGDVPDGHWGGEVLVTTQGDGSAPRRFVARVPAAAIRLSTTRADLALGTCGVTVLGDGRYAVRATAREEHGPGAVVVDLVVTPTPRAYFPGVVADTDATSGYVVPALRADATGRICVSGVCERFVGAQAYHDHNWGTWRGVTWEWGAARVGRYAVLYGRVQPPDSLAGAAPLFVYLVDSLGFRALFRPERIQYVDRRLVRVGGRTVRVPAHAELIDARGADTLRLELTVESAIATDTRRPGDARGGGSASAERRLAQPYFVQMKGRAQLSGRVDGAPIAGDGTGFFETYR